MCELRYKEDKERLRANPNYASCYHELVGKLRELQINPQLAGFEFLIQAVCAERLLGYQDEEDIFGLLETIKMVPSIAPVVKDIHPIEQCMKEALRAAGIPGDPLEFVRAFV